MFNVHQLRSPLFGPISLTIEPGECVAIRGPSGAGKSLFLRALADLDPTSGTVTLDGVDREAISGAQWRQRVAYVPARTGWWDDRVDAHFPADRTDDVQDLFAALGLSPDALQWQVERLSTGETQRLAIARAALQKPTVLLLDEPSASLDGAATERLEAFLTHWQSEGLILLVVTHDPAQAERIASRRFWLEQGRLHDSVPTDAAQ